MSDGGDGHAYSSGEPEISDLEITLIIYQKVLRFEISMQDSVSVTILDAFGQLMDEGPDFLICKCSSSLFQVLLEVVFHILKDQIEDIIVGAKHFLEPSCEFAYSTMLG